MKTHATVTVDTGWEKPKRSVVKTAGKGVSGRHRSKRTRLTGERHEEDKEKGKVSKRTRRKMRGKEREAVPQRSGPVPDEAGGGVELNEADRADVEGELAWGHR